MADESPSEREERLTHQEERLERQHERLKEGHPATGGQPQTKSFGKGLADLGSFFGEHKIIVILLGFVVVLVILVRARQGASSASGTSAPSGCVDASGNAVSCSDPNAVGSLGAAGYMPSGVAYGLDQITQQLNNLTTNLQNLVGTGSGASGPSGGGTGTGAGGTGGQNQPPPGGLQGGNPPQGGPLPQQPNWLWQQLHGNYPIIPSGAYHGPSFSNLKPGTKYTYQGVTYTLTTSVPNMPGSGMLYGITSGGRVVSLYGPPSAYPPPNAGGTHDPIQTGIMSHAALYHRAPGVPMPNPYLVSGGASVKFRYMPTVGGAHA